MLKEIWAKIRNLTTGEKKAYKDNGPTQFRKNIVWFLAYVQKPMYDLAVDAVKLAFSIVFIIYCIIVIVNAIAKLWR